MAVITGLCLGVKGPHPSNHDTWQGPINAAATLRTWLMAVLSHWCQGAHQLGRRGSWHAYFTLFPPQYWISQQGELAVAFFCGGQSAG